MTIEEMIRRKTELGYSNEKIAELSGVPFGTVQKIFGRVTKSPHRETVIALERVLGKRGVSYPDQSGGNYYFLHESQPQYGAVRSGEHTASDYYSLPDERRAELIDGYIYDLAAPSFAHQTIVSELCAAIRECIRANECDCRVMGLPIDVFIDRDDRTILQPDLFIFCGMENVRNNRYFGAPDFVAEVISPSSRRMDMFIKLNKYKFAGVREYWLIDPKYKVISVYDFEKELPVRNYSFNDRIPIAISEGKCEIDFSLIDREAAQFYDLEER